MKVMVVDDDMRMARTLCDILILEGFQAEKALSGEEAVLRLESVQPDCILMDLKMPGIDGISALRLIRKKHPEIPVVMMSAFATEKQMEEAEMEGACAMFKKPLDIKALLSLLSGIGSREAVRWKRSAS